MSEAKELLKKSLTYLDALPKPSALRYDDAIGVGIGYALVALVTKMFEIEDETEEIEKEVGKLNKKKKSTGDVSAT